MTPKEWKQLFSTETFRKTFSYQKDDLGAGYEKERTTFKLWSPTADAVKLNLYRAGEGGAPYETIMPKRAEAGVYEASVDGDLHGVYYDYEVTVDGVCARTADPYAIACGVNGERSMVADLTRTNPDGWEADAFVPDKEKETVIYELHVKDFSYDADSGIRPEYRGKYLAFTENGTTLRGEGMFPTGMDYLKALGVTYVHLLPVFDYGSVDERVDGGQFNWGYDPKNYNVPEGSYATDPFDGCVRIRELKQMVQAFHKAGIGVVMDVVYNHTYVEDSWFQRTVPYYYYRQREDGSFSDGSGCGNETASEREMAGRYIKSSVLYWQREYHIDGFRFDLMGLHNVELMNEIRDALDALPGGKDILMYGEPWTADVSLMEEGFRPAVKANLPYLKDRIAVFCDNTRDAVKGHVFYAKEPGFVNGGEGLEEHIRSSVAAWCDRDYGWNAKSPSQIITYVSAHDNYTLWDKLTETSGSDEDELLRENKLAAAIVFTSQGIPFFQAGEEFARTKKGISDSYNAPPEINCLDWNRAYKYRELTAYYQGLIAIRNGFAALREHDEESVKRIQFQDAPKGMVAFRVEGIHRKQDRWETLYVIYNSRTDTVRMPVAEGVWDVLADGEGVNIDDVKRQVSEYINVMPKSAVILGR